MYARATLASKLDSQIVPVIAAAIRTDNKTTASLSEAKKRKTGPRCQRGRSGRTGGIELAMRARVDKVREKNVRFN